MQIKFQKLRPDAIIPQQATSGSAGIDLSWTPSTVPRTLLTQDKFMAMDAKEESNFPRSYVFETGLAVQIPESYVWLLFSRSGHGFHANVRLANCVGVIDSDYRGEIMVKLVIDHGFHRFQIGERIAQLVIVQTPMLEIVEAAALDTNVERKGGMGSTGR